MSKALRDENILKSNGLTRLGFKSWFSLWWWLKKTYFYPYCIEAYSRRVGFIGLHNPNPDGSVEMSLVIFKKEDRRHGYGTKAFSMLEQTIRQSRYFKKVIVRVRGDNNTSISFWSKLGFKKADNYGGLIVMLQTLY